MLTVRAEDNGVLVGLLEIQDAGDDATHVWALWRKEEEGGRVMQGRLTNFDRSRGAWPLVAEVLANTAWPSRQKEGST